MMKTIAAAVLAVALIGGGVWYATSSKDTTESEPLASATPDTSTTPVAAPAPSAAAIDPALLADRTLGNPEAPIKVTEYASFTCPHCANFHSAVFKDLKTNYIDTGKVFFTYREVYFDRYGLWAGMIARCGGVDRYFGFVDVFYTSRDTWLSSDDPAVISGNLKRIGRTAGMTDEALDQCLNNTAFAEALVANFKTNSEQDDITGTPSFMIDGVKHKNMSYAEFAALLDAKLAE